MAKMRPVRMSRTLPIILSREEVSRLLEAAKNLKHQTALSVAYGAGLRVSEVTALKVGDIDSKRMLLRVEQGKGQKDRHALLPPLLLERLRTWWRFARAQGKVLPGGGSRFHKAAGGIVQLSGEALPIWKRATRLQAADIAVYSLNRTTGNHTYDRTQRPRSF